MARTEAAARHRWTHYLVVWLALVGLTALSLLLSFAHLGSLDTALSLLIAAAKSTIVLLFFMHLIEERFTVRMVPVLALAYVALLLALMATDVLGRRTFPRAPVPLDEPGEEGDAGRAAARGADRHGVSGRHADGGREREGGL